MKKTFTKLVDQVNRKKWNRLTALLCVFVLMSALAVGCNNNTPMAPDDSGGGGDPTETMNTTTAATTATIKDEPMATTAGDDETGTTSIDNDKKDGAQGTSAPTEKVTATTKKETTATKKTSPPTEPGHKHAYVTRVVEADCLSGGYTTHICACGDSYVDHETPKTGHTSTWRMVKASTPTQEGLKEHYCSCCGKVLRNETIPKKQEEYKIDSRVKIEKMRWTNEPVYVYKKARVIDGRTWGEAPAIEVLKDDSLKVTYYTQRGEKVVLTVEQPAQSDRLTAAEISYDGTYTCNEFSSFS